MGPNGLVSAAPACRRPSLLRQHGSSSLRGALACTWRPSLQSLLPSPAVCSNSKPRLRRRAAAWWWCRRRCVPAGLGPGRGRGGGGEAPVRGAQQASALPVPTSPTWRPCLPLVVHHIPLLFLSPLPKWRLSPEWLIENEAASPSTFGASSPPPLSPLSPTAQVEAELNGLDKEEAAEYLAALGVQEGGLKALIR